MKSQEHRSDMTTEQQLPEPPAGYRWVIRQGNGEGGTYFRVSLTAGFFRDLHEPIIASQKVYPEDPATVEAAFISAANEVLFEWQRRADARKAAIIAQEFAFRVRTKPQR